MNNILERLTGSITNYFLTNPYCHISKYSYSQEDTNTGYIKLTIVFVVKGNEFTITEQIENKEELTEHYTHSIIQTLNTIINFYSNE